MPAPACRLYVILARAARLGVVFRRGPSRQVRLIRWNLENDTFEPGQWFEGRIYERRCDLSPEGELLIYFAAKHRPPLYSWTAVSRPPWYTALALWPKSSRQIRLNHGPCQAQPMGRYHLPPTIQVAPLGALAGGGEDDPIEALRLARDGWRLMLPGAQQAEQDRTSLRWRFTFDRLWQKPQPGTGALALRMSVRAIGEHDGPWYRLDHDVVDPTGTIRVFLPDTDWADWDRNGDLLFSRQGSLFRLAAALVRQGDDFAERARCLADFSETTFEAIVPPPAATRLK